MAAAATLLVSRPRKDRRDLLRTYWLEVDGTRVARIHRGQQIEIPIAAGRHVVRATIDWSGSQPLDVDLAEGDTVRLKVECGGGAFAGAWHVFMRDRWLKLAAEQPA